MNVAVKFKYQTMQSPITDKKRKPLIDITNRTANLKSNEEDRQRWAKFDESHWFPLQPIQDVEEVAKLPEQFQMQNIHPQLALYDATIKTEHISHDELSFLLNPDNETELLTLLTQTGVIANQQTCKYCGCAMHQDKISNNWVWICNRRVNGVKCTRGKFSIRDGTFLGKSHLSIQAILWIVWHFVHKLNEMQCKQYTNIGQKNCKTIVKWYAKCREVCGTWIWANKPKLGGFGKIVEMDESYFAGASKYGKGRRLGEDPWEDLSKWAFGLAERGSLDCVLQTVHSSRSRALLMPMINENCADGTIFCSDGWKAYVKLSEHVELEDTLHFAVNHTNNYVDPITGAHTQTIEGIWNHCKSFLPMHGVKPQLLQSYLSSFMWFRYVKQRNLDVFKHFLISAAVVFKATTTTLPNGSMVRIQKPIGKSSNYVDDDFV